MNAAAVKQTDRYFPYAGVSRKRAIARVASRLEAMWPAERQLRKPARRAGLKGGFTTASVAPLAKSYFDSMEIELPADDHSPAALLDGRSMAPKKAPHRGRVPGVFVQAAPVWIWLRKIRKSRAWLASQLGISRDHLSTVLHGIGRLSAHKNRLLEALMAGWH